MNDIELLRRAVLYGRNALEWRRKFMGLLPEIYKRKLYFKKGCQSIYEFAAKFGGVSREQVERVMSVERKFREKGAVTLRDQLIKGEVSVNKLARVASVANAETDKVWASQVKILPKRAVETLVRDSKFVPGHNLVELCEEVKNRLQAMTDRGVDVNHLLIKLLDEHEAQKKDVPETKSRYIPARTRRVLSHEYGTKCVVRTCNRPSEEIDHVVPFSMINRHDPRLMRPLCKPHHQIAHAIDRRVMGFY